MKREYFREVEVSRSGKPWSIYNLVSQELSKSDRMSCEGCNYRISKLKAIFVEQVLGVIGFNARKYDARQYCNFTPNCNRPRCLLDGLALIEDGAKAPSSLIKRLLNPENLTKSLKEEK